MRKEFTIVIIPNYQNKSYSKTISLATLRLLLVLLILFILGLGTTIFFLTRYSYQMLRMSYLIRRNAQLEAEYAKLEVVKNRLAQLEAESKKIKNMLGVEKSPPKIDFLSLTGNEVSTPIETDKSALAQLPPELTKQLAEEKVQYIPAQPPLVNYLISREFDSKHQGVDLVAPLGTPIAATADGVIKTVGEDSIYGKYIVIEHGSDYTSFYGHLRRAIRHQGEKVKKGDFIGYLGATGQVTAPHLHFEISYKGKRVDPASLLRLR
ncbi:MAG: peptidoglycan DD-metalloendopeptidase family protein [candidate division WOR-3 bacterium]